MRDTEDTVLFVNVYERNLLLLVCFVASLALLEGACTPGATGRPVWMATVALFLGLGVRCARRPAVRSDGTTVRIAGVWWTVRLAAADVEAWSIQPGTVGALSRSVLAVRLRGSDEVRRFGHHGIWARPGSDAELRLADAVRDLPTHSTV